MSRASYIPQSAPFQANPMEYCENTMHNDMSSWSADYSPGVDNWLQTNGDWPMFDTDFITSPTTEMYIQPQVLDMYNSPLSTSSGSGSKPRTNSTSHFSDISSPAATSVGEDDDDFTPRQESTYTTSPVATAAPRKRGRPRTIRTPEDTLYENTVRSPKQSKRQPHNQVERKYREGLNSELERLRMALPMTRWEMNNGCGSGVKASKAAVLAGAVAYIHDLEQERDHLRRENEIYRSGGRVKRSSYE